MFFCFACFSKKTVKTAVPGDANLPEALILTKLVEQNQFACLSLLFKKNDQNVRPRRRKPPRSISFDETSRMKSVCDRRRQVNFCVFLLLLSDRISEHFATTSSNKTCASEFHHSNSRKARNPPTFDALFFGLWRGETCSRTFVLEAFAKCSVIVSDDNTKTHLQNEPTSFD